MAREARVDRLEAALVRLAEAQAETQAALQSLAARVEQLAVRLDQLAARVDELAQAQARTEARLDQLAQAQARTEARLDQLAQAQARTEEAVRVLAQQVGRLSDTIGFSLEDLARELAPAYLAERHAIRVGSLERRFFKIDGREVEIDLYGEGTRDHLLVTVVGEVRSRIHGDDVHRMAQRAVELEPHLPGQPVVLLFGFVIHPSAREAAERLGAIVISSSGR